MATASDAVGAPNDADAFTEWVRPHVAAMARLASRLAPDADRDDIVQEALTRAWLKRRLYDPRRGTAVAWLLAVTADRARRARPRRQRFALVGEISVREAPSDDRLDIETAVAGLPPRQRLAIDCTYFVGLSVAETAAVMGCSEGTVKSTLSDGRRNLRRLLEGSHE